MLWAPREKAHSEFRSQAQPDPGSHGPAASPSVVCTETLPVGSRGSQQLQAPGPSDPG